MIGVLSTTTTSATIASVGKAPSISRAGAGAWITPATRVRRQSSHSFRACIFSVRLVTITRHLGRHFVEAAWMYPPPR